MDEEPYNIDLTKTEERLKNKVQKKIYYCSECQPYDGGEPVWIYGEPIDLDDLLMTCNIEEKYWDKITACLSCPNCGNSFLEISSRVALQTKYEKELESLLNKTNLKFRDKINKLTSLLEATPFLAYKDPLAKKIYKEIKEKTFPITKVNLTESYFRARKVNNKDIFDSSKMLNAPKGKPTEGRYNHSGQSHLYISESKETAIKEVAQNDANFLVWVQEIKFENEFNNILDLTFDSTNISTVENPLLLSLSMFNVLGSSKKNLEYWRPDYFMTRYIMDCTKDLGYNGIKYNSTKTEFEFNIVLFYPEKNKIKYVGKPIIEIFRTKNNLEFDDF